MAALTPGTKAPSFELSDVEGKKQNLTNLPQGGVGVVAFFKENCPTCHFAFPFLEKLYRHHKGDAKVRFMAVAQEDQGGARTFIKNFGLTMPVALDSRPYRVSEEYGLTNVPTVFIVNDSGAIQQTLVGFVKKEYEEAANALAKITGKKSAPIFEGENVPELKPG